jgi:hypothetical protein
MPRFRLTYPAHLYVTVAAPTLEAARQQFAAALAGCQDGLRICLGHPDEGDVEEEILYPDSNAQGEVTVDLVLLEDVEPEDEEGES